MYVVAVAKAELVVVDGEDGTMSGGQVRGWGLDSGSNALLLTTGAQIHLPDLEPSRRLSFSLFGLLARLAQLGSLAGLPRCIREAFQWISG